MRAGRAVAALLVGVSLTCAGWYWAGRAQPVPGALAPGQRLDCASYTPFQGAENPASFTVERGRLERDFALLSSYVACIRIYSVKGMELVPEVAREHGLQVIAGAWVNREDADTERELAEVIELARRYPDVIRAVLVGNEVLLRRERTAAQLGAYLRRVREAVAQPVSYGDVWEFWLQSPSIGADVDFVTIHLLPYWENDPTGIEGAIDALARARGEIAAAFPGKPILIGETGWPSEGRRREDAQPGRVNQARFVRGFLQRAARDGWSYNLIEAFDQPWKRGQEGAVGGYWGLFDAAREDKGILRGDVSDFPAWRVALLSALGLWALLALAGRSTDPIALLVQAICANGVVHQLHRMALQSRGPAETGWFVLLAAFAVAATWFLSSARRAGERPAGTDAALVCCAALAAVEMLGLAFDPRYRDFPTAVFLAPALALAGLGVQAPGWRERGRALGLLFLLCMPAVLWQETVFNPMALAWLGVCGLFATGVLRAPAHAGVAAPVR